jgi:hypothetical protein
MGQNVSQFIVSDFSWSPAKNADTKYPTDGFETTTVGQPLTLQVDTTSPDGRPVTVFIVYTKAQDGIGSAEVR